MVDREALAEMWNSGKRVKTIAAHFGISVGYAARLRQRFGLPARRNSPRFLTGDRRGPKPLPVVIRGKVFDSVASAAAHFEIDPSTIYDALKRGCIDNVGLGRGHHSTRRLAKPIRIGPHVFKSRRQLAERTGLTFDAVCYALKKPDSPAAERLLGIVMELSV